MKRLIAFAFIATLVARASGSLYAETVPFIVDPNASSLSISTSIAPVFGVIPVPNPTRQGDDSFLASYGGIVFADITPTSIQFLPSTSLVAGISGNWQPGDDYSNYTPDDPGSYPTDFAPANYGSVTDLTGVNGTTSKSAVRDLKISLSDDTPKSLAGGVFEEAGTLTDFTAGTIFYESGAAPPITDMVLDLSPGSLANAGTGMLSGSGYGAVLTIPVSFSVTYDVSVLHITTTYSGTIVATAVPEPATGVLLLIAGSLVGCRRRYM